MASGAQSINGLANSNDVSSRPTSMSSDLAGVNTPSVHEEETTSISLKQQQQQREQEHTVNTTFPVKATNDTEEKQISNMPLLTLPRSMEGMVPIRLLIDRLVFKAYADLQNLIEM
jgi:hypothetical protein